MIQQIVEDKLSEEILEGKSASATRACSCETASRRLSESRRGKQPKKETVSKGGSENGAALSLENPWFYASEPI